MILISHRGNTLGKLEPFENKPDYIDKAIEYGFDVEVDVWVKNNVLFLGHDEPRYEVKSEWFEFRSNKLWVHCKNIDAIEWFNNLKNKYNYFWHQKDDLTITSFGYLWVYPGKQPVKKSIAVIPELHNEDLSVCGGVCSDNIINYRLNDQK